MMIIDTSTQAQHRGLGIYWGLAPLPSGASCLGTVQRDVGDTGALLRLSSGIYVQGNASVIRTLDQRLVRSALAGTGS